jgi:uncharacterized repeat protein (TIGR03803 family)
MLLLVCGSVSNANAESATAKILHSFTGSPDGQQPLSGLFLGDDGNYYGTTASGGTGLYAAGTLFKITPTGSETVLYSFDGQNTYYGGGNCYSSCDGATPVGGVTMGADGSLYGTTYGGGQFGWGTVFQLSSSGDETLLYSFGDGYDGGLPSGNLVRDIAGNLYGVTSASIGYFNNGYGTVFRISPSGQVVPSSSRRPAL